MNEPSPLSRASLDDFRRRYRQAQGGSILIAVLYLLLALTTRLSAAIWVGLIVAAGIICFVLEYRGQKCPRCGGFVFGEIAEDTPGISALGRLPERCKRCGVKLRIDRR